MIRIESHTVADKPYTLAQGTAADLATIHDNVDKIPEVNRKRYTDTFEAWGESARGGGMDFGGLENVAQAAAIFQNDGWQEGETRARREVPTLGLSDLTPQATSRRRRRVFSDTGDTLRIDSALAGDWDRAYETRQKRQTNAPTVISIGCAFGSNADMTQGKMFWAGVQMAAITELLENSGWRIELRALKVNDFYGKNIHVQDWTVKQADQPLRWDTTLALFGHVGVYRGLGWAGNMFTAAMVPYGMGTVLAGKDMLKTVNRLADAGVIPPVSILLPLATSRSEVIFNISDALEQIRKQTGTAA